MTQEKSNGFDQPSRLPEPEKQSENLAIKAAKPDLSLVTRAMMEGLAAALANGTTKYGRASWRSRSFDALTFTAAAVRHIKAYEDGEDHAADSGVHHLDHAIASLCIMRDAAAFGTLVDNRELGARLAAADPVAPEYGVFYAVNGRTVRASGEPGFGSEVDARNRALALNGDRLFDVEYFVKELDR
jgi:hypothetical protein